MYCNNCGAANSDSSMNCSACGKPLRQDTRVDPQQSETTTFMAQDPTAISQTPSKTPGKGAGTAALVLGIASIAVCSLTILSMVLGVVGIIFGVIAILKAKKGHVNCGMGISGLILSIIGIFASILIGIYTIGIILAFLGIAIESF